MAIHHNSSTTDQPEAKQGLGIGMGMAFTGFNVNKAVNVANKPVFKLPPLPPLPPKMVSWNDDQISLILGLFNVMKAGVYIVERLLILFPPPLPLIFFPATHRDMFENL